MGEKKEVQGEKKKARWQKTRACTRVCQRMVGRGREGNEKGEDGTIKKEDGEGEGGGGRRKNGDVLSRGENFSVVERESGRETDLFFFTRDKLGGQSRFTTSSLKNQHF